jgi:hypothetical protein
MAPPSPARLYASAGGALLIVLGIAGFFFDRDWVNFFHLAAGALGILLAPAAPRLYALGLGLVFIGLAAWGFADGQAWMQWLHLALGLLGLAAYAGSEPRAQPAESL